MLKDRFLVQPRKESRYGSFLSQQICYCSLRAIRKTALSALSATSNASVRRNAHLLRLQDAMLMKWRSLRTFMQADFHARQKKAHKNVRVNCNISVNIALRSA